MTYYTVIIAWSIIYFLSSFDSSLPWAAGTSEESLDVASTFFNDDVLKLGAPEDGLEVFRP